MAGVELVSKNPIILKWKKKRVLNLKDERLINMTRTVQNQFTSAFIAAFMYFDGYRIIKREVLTLKC